MADLPAGYQIRTDAPSSGYVTPPRIFTPSADAALKQNGIVASRDGVLRAIGKKFGQGASFGFLDEATAALLTPFLNDGNETYATTYQNLRDDARAGLDQDTIDHPVASRAAELAGGLTSGIASAGLGTPAEDASLLAKVGAGVRTGAGAGAIAGAGNSNADTATGILRDAGLGAAAGASIGYIAPGVGEIAGDLAPSFTRLIQDESGHGPILGGSRVKVPKFSAAEATTMRGLIEEEGLTPQQAADRVRNAGQPGPDGVTLTLPEASASSRLSGYEGNLRQIGGKAKDVYDNFLDARNKGFPGTYDDFISSNVGTPRSPELAGSRAAATAQNVIDRASAVRQAKAAPFYEQAYAQNLSEDAASDLVKNPIIGDALGRVQKDPAFRAALQNDDPLSVQRFHLAQQNIDDQISAAQRTGENVRARQLVQARNKLSGTLQSEVPAFGQAQKTFAAESPRVDRITQILQPLTDGDPGKAAKTLFQSSPREIRYARRLIATEDEGAWNDLIASHLSQIGEDTNHSPARFLNRISSLGSAGSASAEAKLNAALTPQQILAKDRFFGEVKRANKIRIGSPTAKNLYNQAEMDSDLSSLAPQAAQIASKTWKQNAVDLYKWVDGRIKAQKYEELAKIWTGQGSADFADRLAQVKPGSFDSYKLVTDRIAKIGSSTAVNSSAGSPASTERQPVSAEPAAAPATPSAALPSGYTIRLRQGTEPAPSPAQTTSPGLRNNNPGNLKGTDPWQGKAGVTKSGFVQFLSPDSGLRAQAINLVNQKDLHGIDTVEKLVAKYAPLGDNNPTAAYAANVANALGVKPTDTIDLSDRATLGKVIRAMIKQENGSQPYQSTKIDAAVMAALKKTGRA